MLDNSHTRVYGCATWHGKMVLTDIYSITEEVTFVFWWRWWWWCCCWCCTAAAVSAVHNELLPCARQWKDEDVWLLFGSPFLVTIHFTHGNLRFTRMPNAMATANGNWEQQDWENTAVAALGDNGLPGCDCFPCCFGGGSGLLEMQSMANSVECSSILKYMQHICRRAESPNNYCPGWQQ